MGEATVPLDVVRQQMLIALQDTPTGSGPGGPLASGTPSSSGAGPSGGAPIVGVPEAAHPKITMNLPLSVRPGQKKDKAAGAITVKFSLYQKQILKPKEDDAPVVAAAAAAAAAAAKDQKSGAVGIRRPSPCVRENDAEPSNGAKARVRRHRPMIRLPPIHTSLALPVRRRVRARRVQFRRRTAARQ